MTGTAAPYVRLSEHVFRVRLTAKDNSSGEWRYAWIEQAFEPDTGEWVDAVSPRQGTVDRNYATDLRGRELPAAGELYWILLKGHVAGQLVYEVDECCAGATFASSSSVTWTTDQDDYQPPANVSIIDLTLATQNVSLTGLVLEDGQTITFVNSQTSTFSLLVPHESLSSTASNRIATVTDQTVVIPPGGDITFWKDPATDRVVVKDITTVPWPMPAAQTATLTTSQDDYPVDGGTSELSFLLTSSDLDFTGVKPLDPSRTSTLTITNDPASTKILTLKVEDSGSMTTSQFRTPGTTTGDVKLSAGTSATFDYDTSLARWVLRQPTPQQPWTPTLSTGVNDNVPLPIGRLPGVMQPTISGATTLTGFPASFPVSQPLTIQNPASSGFDLTIANADGGSDLDFITSTGADVVLSPGESLTVSYDGTTINDVGGSLSLSPGSGARTETTLVATGNAQGNAAAITNSQGAVEVTGADGTKGVILADVAATSVVVWNHVAGPNSLKVYPPSGATILAGGLAMNAPYLVAGGGAAVFYRIASTTWQAQDTP